MALLFSVMLVSAAGNTAMQSVMPSIGTALGVADVWISLAYTWSALLWMLCAPLWARRSDRRGRKAMMALGLVGFSVSMATCGVTLWLGLAGWLPVVWTLVLFAAFRSLYGGFGSAAPPAVQAYVASRTEPHERTNALSLVASSFGLGTVIGPALAPLLILPGLGLTGPFIVFAAIGVATLAALRLLLPDDEPRFAGRGSAFAAPYGANTAPPPLDDEKAPASAQAPADASATRLRWRDPRVWPWIVAGLLGSHAQAMLIGLAGFLVLDRLGLRADPASGAGYVGIVLMSGALATLLAQWGVIPRLHLGPRAAVLWGAALAIAGIGIFALAPDVHGIAFGYAVASLGFGLFRPGFTAGASLAVSRAEQGQVSGIVASVAGAAYVFAPALGVYLYGVSAWLAFAVIALLCALVLARGVRALAPDPPEQAANP
ncbi:MFS transporter [Erythrobacteraceae bacterium CFH 75059]|nr:MFS transporter [Qipengyuania thermophila]TCD04138.1 MFS transporter [Erythrobacteraceae bacterium CFH 75059]